MGSELTTNGAALRLFFTDDIYLIKGEEGFSTEEVVSAEVQVFVSDSGLDPVNGGHPEITQELNPVGSSVPGIIPIIPAAQEERSELPRTKETIPVIPAAIVQPKPAPVPAVETQKAFKFLGKNKKKILILVNDPDHEVSDEAGRELLRKIVKSINLTASDFALLNYAAHPGTNFNELQQYFSSVLVFAFGVSPEMLELPVQAENKLVMEGDVRLIFSEELRKLEQNPAGKKALWGSLKQLGI
ncbi:hypothetical protein [Pedobacter gandavensis]|uniref:hypothetical protein n=1 Tax=Pedobacter gandavensis TaxID=2679963 RepID=UPI002931A763|nr:hypothetical protein [Pedobacter gandavensis]